VANKVLVIGSSGQVGRALKEVLGPSAILAGRELFDLSKPRELGARILEIQPDIVINAAAYTQVDLAEKEESLAHTINAEAPLEMAKACHKLKSIFVTYSTDYVYSGTGSRAWVETDSVAPQNAYGRTKAAGEKLLMEWAPSDLSFLILRTSWVYSFAGKNFFLTMLKLGAEREELKIVEDQIGAPTYAPHLAQGTSELLLKLRDPGFSGIYNICGAGETSWFHFAEEIFARARLRGMDLRMKKLIGIPSSEFPTPASRPLNSRLNQTKLFDKFAVALPHWTLGLDECLTRTIK